MGVIIVSLVTGGLYALLAVGFSLIYGTARILNLAHTAFYMLAAYFIFVAVKMLGLNLILAAVVSILVTTLIGIVYYKLLIAPIREHEITVLMVTAAAALLFQESTKQIFTSSRRAVPMFVSGSTEVIGVSVSYQYLITFGVAVVSLLVMWFWLYRTRTGTAIRCTAQDREVANLMGINVGRICLLATAVSVALAAICGAVVAPIFIVEPHMWMHPLVMVLAVVVLGGLGSIKGSITGAFILALAETLVATLIPSGSFFKGAVALGVMVVVLLIRPEGLFGVVFEEERL